MCGTGQGTNRKKMIKIGDIWFVPQGRYIDYELKKGDPVRIEFVYERSTTQLCLDPALWIKYLGWARKIKSPNLPKIAKRATRNCSWEGQLWTLRLKILEEKNFEKEEIGKPKLHPCINGQVRKIGHLYAGQGGLGHEIHPLLIWIALTGQARIFFRLFCVIIIGQASFFN